ncbi:hypothetical protein NQ315_004403 [Exocentrus adspersus]|uniref:Uncharacterized protein n=1 Tax=Exocentrus adspersus TaxID=1586481 RepID=A0AAV8W7B2_9CUCU|nr:hypothetical protein NQ315_004403 [Exocentrus adspersus]
MASIRIQTGKHQIQDNSKDSNVQSLPCRIHADCDASVAQYFDNYVKTKEDGTLSGSFRGYPLRGKKVQVPEGYSGLVLHESSRPSDDKEERTFHVAGKFEEMTFWNWDKATGDGDGITRALEWIEIAKALHSPIEGELFET